MAARAQQPAMPVIGLLHRRLGRDAAARELAAFFKGCNEGGYIDGQNVAIEYRWAEGQYDRIAGNGRGTGRACGDVVLAVGTPARWRPGGNPTIPIVFRGGGRSGRASGSSRASAGQEAMSPACIFHSALEREERGSVARISLPDRRRVAMLRRTRNIPSGRQRWGASQRGNSSRRRWSSSWSMPATERDFDAVRSRAAPSGGLTCPDRRRRVFINSHRERIIALGGAISDARSLPWREFPLPAD